MSLPNSNARLLIIDDDPAVREVLVEFLGYRYECTGVGSAEEALAHLRGIRQTILLTPAEARAAVTIRGAFKFTGRNRPLRKPRIADPRT